MTQTGSNLNYVFQDWPTVITCSSSIIAHEKSSYRSTTQSQMGDVPHTAITVSYMLMLHAVLL